jgi:FkbM family methyltransferase
MSSSPKLFLGRAWRKANRIVSRLYLKTFCKVAPHALTRHGSDYGGWYAPDDMPAGALCYCIGVGRDATFDFALGDLGAEVHAFDPTPLAVDYMAQHTDKQVTFHPWGLWDSDKTMKFYVPYGEGHASHFTTDLHGTGRYHEVPCYALDTIRRKLGHEDREIYLLKMDIEGAWYESLLDFIPKGTRPTCLGVEFDSPAPVWRVARVVTMLQKHGYRVAVIEKDNVTFMRRPDA